jgi:hypothetical protein
MSGARGLSTDYINRVMDKLTSFKGTYPCDEIPNFTENEYSIIVNVDNSNLPGSHWTALVIRGNNAYYFDSFGRLYDNFSFPPDYRENLQNICLGKKVIFQEKVLQGFHSNTCGEYCIYFIDQLEKRIKFTDIFRSFTENLKSNDKKIMKLYSKI